MKLITKDTLIENEVISTCSAHKAAAWRGNPLPVLQAPGRHARAAARGDAPCAAGDGPGERGGEETAATARATRQLRNQLAELLPGSTDEV